MPALSLAIRLALLDTRLPKTTPVQIAESIQAASNTSASHDFTVDDDLTQARPLSCAKRLPIYTLVNFIGPHIVFDASAEEEAVVRAQLRIGVSENGNLVNIRTTGLRDPRSAIQGKEVNRGLTNSTVQQGIQEGCRVTALLFKEIAQHSHRPPSDIFSLL